MRYGGHARSRGSWLAPILVLVAGYGPLLLITLGDSGRSLSTFPASLQPGWIVWAPGGGPLVLVALVAPFLLSFLTWYAKQLLVTPWPALLACMVLSAIAVVGSFAFERAGGSALYPDRVVFRPATPWSAPQAVPLSQVVLIEKGCSFGRHRYGRRGNSSGIYSLVFADGRRVTLGSDGRGFGLSTLDHLDLLERVDAFPDLRDTDRRVRRFMGGEVNDPGCIADLASGYPAQRRDDIIRIFSLCRAQPPGAVEPDKTAAGSPASPDCERSKAILPR